LASITISAPSSAIVNKSFTINGYVEDDQFLPLVGVTVQLYQNGVNFGSAVTNLAGRYSKIHSIGTSGIYELAAFYGAARAYRDITVSEGPPPPKITTVTISAPSSNIEDIAFTISGYVRDQYGGGMAGISVSLYQNGEQFAVVTTNSSGQYSRSRIITSPGVYELATNAGSEWAYRDITITEKNVGTTLNVNSPAEVFQDEQFSVSGRLTQDDTGGGLGGRSITIFVDGIPIGSTPTDSAGYYSTNLSINVIGLHMIKASF